MRKTGTDGKRPLSAVEGRLVTPPPVEAAAPVRRLLQETGYAEAAALLGDRERLPDGPTAVLVQLLALDVAVPVAQTAPLTALVEAGLVTEEDGWLVPRARVAVVDGVLVAGDPPRCAEHPEFVAPVSSTSRTAAALTVRRPARTGLDLCTGSGVLALLLARHCEHVVATDVAPRALAWAQFNAALNGAVLELRCGSLTDPVSGERFEVVSANPPYVVGLDDALAYRDSPLPGDGVSEAVVRALPALLAPGGWAATTLSWTGTDATRPQAWLADSGLAGWLITGSRQGVREHALSYAGTGRSPRSRGERVARWTVALEAAGAAGVSEGALVLHARPGRLRSDDGRLPVTAPHGEQVARAVAARQHEVGEESVLALSPDVALIDGGTRVLRWGGTLADLTVDPHTARLLAAVDGRRRLGGLLREVVAGSGGDVAERGADAVRELVDAGVLVPSPGPVTVRSRGLPPPVVAAGDGPPLVADLASAGYRSDALAALLGTSPARLLSAVDLPAYPLRVPESGVGALARLLLLELPVRAADLPPGLEERLTATGLAVADGARLLPATQLVPYGDLLIASDLPSAMERPDVVVGVQPPTATLANLTPRRPVDRALDLGTGCGLQAVLLAAHARHVVATDVNPRALAFAAANAGLAGVSVEQREGAWFEPVEDERFDLLVTNPPYVLSPDRRWTFRDAGLPRDGASRLVAAALPGHLREGGLGMALLSWVDAPEEPPAPLRWSAGQGCDALLLATGTAGPWETATAWNRDQRDPQRYAAEVARWLDWLRSEEIQAVEYGALLLHRTGGDSARRVGLPGRPDGPSGEQVLRLMAAPTQAGPGSVLLPAPDVVLEQAVRSGDGGWSSGSVSLRQAGGLGLSTTVDDAVSAVLSQLAPGRTLREAAGSEQALAAALPGLAWLLAVGLLIPG